MVTRTDSVSMKAVRKNCLECSGGSARQVLWCPCNGHTSTDCVFWASRFGVRPETFINRHGPYLLTPEIMPAADVDLEELPNTVAGASEWLREQYPAIDWSGPKEPDPERVKRGQRAMARLQASQRGGQEINSEPDSLKPGPRLVPSKPR